MTWTISPKASIEEWVNSSYHFFDTVAVYSC